MRTLAHLDCQAQTVGRFGFQALSEPGATGAIVLTSLLTLCIAIYGIRLSLGLAREASDLINIALKVGIVLTLAASWPAWRVLAYDTVLYGPAEVAGAILPSSLPSPQADLPRRLQGIDEGIAKVTLLGTGRIESEQGDRLSAAQFQSIALADATGLGWSRTIYLASTVGSLGLLRVGGGLLLALAPLLAGLLLFDATRGIFIGWLRGLAFVAIGSLGITLLLSVQVALLEPWLADVINRRNANFVTPAAPTELLAMVLGFTIATFFLLFLLGRVVFHNSWPTYRLPVMQSHTPTADAEPHLNIDQAAGGEIPVHARARAISESVTTLARREAAMAGGMEPARRVGVIARGEAAPPEGTVASRAYEPLGSSYRRTSGRETALRHSRDDRQ